MSLVGRQAMPWSLRTALSCAELHGVNTDTLPVINSAYGRILGNVPDITLPTQQTQQSETHAFNGIRTRDPSNQARLQTLFRPHRDRHLSSSSSSSSSSYSCGAGGITPSALQPFEAFVPRSSPEALHVKPLSAKGGIMGEKWPV
jgi:hypothetical protein